MNATLTVQGFGFSPDEAIEDLHRRCQSHNQGGWLRPTEATVSTGSNPYSVMPVFGYVATTRLTKEHA
jgi:hypothetical protein